MSTLQRSGTNRLVILFCFGVLTVLISFCAGVLTATMTRAPGAIDHQVRRVVSARQATAVSDIWHQHWLSFDPGHAGSFGVMQPTAMATQAPLGGTLTYQRSGNADVTGSVAASAAGDAAAARPARTAAADAEPKTDRLAGGAVAPAEPKEVARILNAGDAASPRGANETVAIKQRPVAPPAREDAHRVVTNTQVALAAAPPQDSNRSAVRPQPDAETAPQAEDARRAAAKPQIALAVAPPVVDSNPNALKRQAEADAGPPIMIGHSADDRDGGDIEIFAAKYEKIKKSGRKVMIDGLCFSACTIVASLPKDQVCVTPRASLGVHLVTSEEGVETEYTMRAVKKYYPLALQDWIKKHGGLTEEPKYVKGNDLLTIFDACKTGDQRTAAAPAADADAHRAPVRTQVALAVAPPADDSDRSVARRESDAGPPVMIGHSSDDHDGGDIEIFAAKYDKIKKSGRKVVIDGLCFSACTIVASLPKDQVCVTPNASLGVHLAESDDGVDTEYTDWAVKKYYPLALQDWIKKHGGLSEEPKYVKGNDLLTIFDACKRGA